MTTQSERQYLTDKQTALRFSVSRQSIWRWANAGSFPKPIKLSEGTARWRVADLEKFEAEKAAGQEA